MEEIRRLAERVAASHHLEVVEVEFGGGGKSRALRVFVEKDAAERAKLKEFAAKAAEGGDQTSHPSGAWMGHPHPELPKGVPVELLSGVTHEDCAAFATDFGTLLDVEDVVPGAEYTLEVSSPGLERRLTRAEDYTRFAGSLIKVKTFTPVHDSRMWTGRLTGFADGVLKMAKTGNRKQGSGNRKQGSGNRKTANRGQETGDSLVEIELKNVEKANLVAEI
jgi:ribosome maturation factor RimP